MDKLGLGNKVKNLPGLKRRLINAIAQNSLQFFKVKSFDNQGFTDVTIDRWKPRKKNRDNDRKLLVDSGRGRSSIHIAKKTDNSAIIQVEADYMRFHNDGTKTIPQRKFMGKSATLDKQNIKIINKEIKSLL